MNILLGILVVVMVIGILFGVVVAKVHSDDADEKEKKKDRNIGMSIVLVCAVLMSVCWTGSCYMSNLSRVAGMVAFEQGNKQAYQYTVDETESIMTVYTTETDKALLLEGSIEKFQIATEVSLRMKELRDKVEKYNNDLAYLEKMNSIPIVSWAYPDTGDLKYIVLE